MHSGFRTVIDLVAAERAQSRRARRGVSRDGRILGHVRGSILCKQVAGAVHLAPTNLAEQLTLPSERPSGAMQETLSTATNEDVHQRVPGISYEELQNPCGPQLSVQVAGGSSDEDALPTTSSTVRICGRRVSPKILLLIGTTALAVVLVAVGVLTSATEPSTDILATWSPDVHSFAIHSNGGNSATPVPVRCTWSIAKKHLQIRLRSRNV